MTARRHNFHRVDHRAEPRFSEAEIEQFNESYDSRTANDLPWEMSPALDHSLTVKEIEAQRRREM